MPEEKIRLAFEGGTIRVSGGTDDVRSSLPGVTNDPRTRTQRAQAIAYREIVEHLIRNKIPYEDAVRQYQPVAWKLQTERKPFPHQIEAVDAWWAGRGRGVVVLPTGTGKTFTAMLAIERAGRPAMIVTPTIDLLNQWNYELSQAFGTDVGAMGGGEYRLQPLTVTTYDSAYIHLERWGNQYGLVVFDECHHLPGPTYALAAHGSIAPFRLGLTATPERADGLDSEYPSLIGPTVYRREIKELSGDFLAEYHTQRLWVELTPEEAERYGIAREIYRKFLASRNITFGSPTGWQRFVFEASRSPEGREAFRAYREQKQIERSSEAKTRALENLLDRHAGDRTIVFTADNATVYRMSRKLLIPAITHQTKSAERRRILERFHSGEYSVVITSQVLNEGVDVPAAGVGIVLSGTGSIRENVQRLGRLLRRHGDKMAVLYEVVVRGTSEESASERRRRHTAFN